jgi:hypothetical protein
MKNLALAALTAALSMSALAAPPITAQTIAATGLQQNVTDASNVSGGQDRLHEDMSLAVVDDGGPVSGAACTLSNDKGHWSASGSNPLRILRSKGALAVTCSKDGYASNTLVVEAGTAEITPKTFLFQGDSDADVQSIPVPAYQPQITVHLSSVASVSPPAVVAQ